MRNYALLLLLLSSISAISQNCNSTLSGQVIDFHDGTMLVGATLIIAGTEQTVETDLDGNFTIAGLCNQTYNIQVSHPFCSTRGYRVKILGDTNKTFKLEHHLEELNEVLLENDIHTHDTETVLGHTLTTEALEQYSNASLGDALNTISGVSSLNTGSSVVKPLINGLHSSRVVLITNGVRMEDQEWGVEHAPTVDVNAFGNIRLIKGATALQYSGDAVGGIIITEPAQVPVKDTLYGKTIVTAVTNGRGTSITSQLTKSSESGWYGVAQGTLKYFGDVEAPDYVLSNTGVQEHSFSLRMGLNRFNYGVEGYYSFVDNSIGILRASHLGGAQDQVRAITSNQPLVINDFTYAINDPKQEVKHHLARLKAFAIVDGLGTLNAQYDFQQNDRLEFDIRIGDDRDKAALDLQLQTHSLLFDIEGNPSERLRLKTGIKAKYQKNFANPDTGIRRLIPDYDRYDLGIYGIADYDVNDRLLVALGGRFDYTFIDAFKFYRTSFWESRNYDEIFPDIVRSTENNQVLTNPKLDFYNPSATIGATYTLGETYTLLLNYALSSRAPNPSELFSEGLHHSASRIELGDLRFTSETAHKVAVTLKREHDRFRFSMEPYINTINNFIVLEPTEIRQTIRGNFQVWEYRQTNAQLLGVDIDASYAFAKNFRFNHQFSLVKGYDRSRDEALINMPPVQTKNEIVYHNEKANNLHLKLQSAYVFRQNEFPNNNFEVFLPETESTTVVDVSTPPSAYHLLHFNSSIDLHINTKTTCTIGVNVTNILNTSYRNYLNRLRYYADDLGRNFLVHLKLNY